MTRAVRTFAVLVAVLTAFAVGVVVLRAATMATHPPVDPRLGLETVVRADVVREPPGAVAPMTRALLDVCRLDVDTELVDSRRIDADEFRFVLHPTLGESDRRRLHGCLEDARLEHLQLDVLEMHTVDELM